MYCREWRPGDNKEWQGMIRNDMAKKRKKKLTPVQEKELDYFTDRLANILIMQVEEEAIKKQEAKRKKKSETKSK